MAKRKQKTITPEEEALIQQLADILVEGYLVNKTKESGKHQEDYQRELCSFRFSKSLRDHCPGTQKA